MASNTAFLSSQDLDFDNLKANFITFLQSQPIFAGYNFAGQNLNVLIDILIKNNLLLAFYLNMVGSEMFLDSAQQRDSIVSKAKELNYVPRSYKSSTALVNLSINVTDNTVNVLTIPSGFSFSGTSNNLIYNFQTIAPITIYRSNNQFIASNVAIYEGFNLTEIFYSNTTSGSQTFVLSNPGINTDTLNVVVQNSNTDMTNSSYLVADNLYGLNANSNIFFLEGSFGNKYQITFGDGVFGNNLVNGNIVYANYIVSLADAPNGINSFRPLNTVSGFNVTCTTTANAAGGAIAESNDSIKYNAPKFYRAQSRAVNESDYEALILDNFSSIETINIYGGETIPNAPQYGKVFISGGGVNGAPVSDTIKQQIISYVSNNSIVTVTPVWADPQYVYIILNSVVTYNVNLTTNTPAAIQLEVYNAIVNYNDTTLNIFNVPFRYSKFLPYIDNADISIVGNETEVTLMKVIVLASNSPQTVTLDFGNAFQDHAADDFSYPVITSSDLVINGTTCNIIDDGNGILNAYQTTSTGRIILQSSVGSVDYTNGVVYLNALNAQSYSNNQLNIYAKPLNTDVLPIRNNIISIETDLATISVVGIAE